MRLLDDRVERLVDLALDLVAVFVLGLDVAVAVALDVHVILPE